jgi:hypothetical protein
MQGRIGYGLVLLLLVSVAEAQWSQPVRITPGTYDATDPALTVDTAGMLHASWSLQIFNPPLFDWVDYICKPAGVDTWMPAVHVSRDSYPLRVSAIAIGPGGVPHIVWISEAEPGYLYITHRQGDTWTIPERLAGWQRWGSQVKAAADRQGTIHVVWGDLTYDYIWYARYDEHGWAGPEAVAFDTTPYAFYAPDVAVDRAGRPHIVYCWGYSIVYSFRTDSGWTEPVPVPTLTGRGDWGRIALDTCDRPHVTCDEPRQVSYTYWTGDSWAAPVRLDSIEGYGPLICCDSWNRIHIVFGEESIGVRERVFHAGRWVEDALVDTWPCLEGAVVAARTRLHLLWRKAYMGRVWYSWRPLSPPGVSGEPPVPGLEVVLRCPNPVLPGSELVLAVPGPERVVIRLYDVAGRLVGPVPEARAATRRLSIKPYGLLPKAGVYYCQIEAGKSRLVLKLVRTK